MLDGFIDTSTQAIPSLPSLKTLRILVVDDRVDDRELFLLMLEQQEAEVTVAASAQEAWEYWQRMDFNLLISDIFMPDEDGFTLIQKIRSQPKSAQIPAIAVSGCISPAYREQALSTGFQKYLFKPVDFDELVNTIFDLQATLIEEFM